MPRRNHRIDQDTGLDEERVRRGYDQVTSAPDGQWTVRPISPGAAEKAYRCPGCDQEIGPGVAHVVAWPADERGDLTDRRHWHTGCWNARGRRRPTTRRP